MDDIGVGIRFAVYADMLIAFGLAAFLLYELGPTGGKSFGVSCRRWLVVAAVVGLIVTTIGVLNTSASMAGIALSAVDLLSLEPVLGGTAFGFAAIVRFAALVIAIATILLIRPPRFALSILTIAWGTALATLAWNGHGVMDEGIAGWAHLIADILHLWAAGLWAGALIGLMLLLGSPGQSTDAVYLVTAQRALQRFSLIGSVLVAVIVISGLLNSLFLIGLANISALWTSLYGQVLLAKLVLFGSMLGLAATNRFLLTPSLTLAISRGQTASAVARLRWSLTFELTSAVGIFGLVAWLGTLAPPLSAA